MESTKIVQDHKKKSDIVRTLKKKLKNRIAISKLEEMLAHEKRNDVDPNHYTGIYEFDDEGYGKAVAKKEARIELLEDIIRNRRMG
ncbi:TPA: hypothetical protein QCW42_004024 [Bacillus cereus]|nr:hypothetical protein [Bacillus cereus]